MVAIHYSLTAGRYVGVETQESNVNLIEESKKLLDDLMMLDEESTELSSKIQKMLSEVLA
ncbi:hypothetical protein J512_3143 [Acinetobacter baumannii 1295743]|uniref:Uncharacterized protein n=1 Tax=Acinetobacter baumannii (strain 1295743) TaxID=1310613 RepID=A0A009IIJ7_ACIB9|nr:hypothetical protein J512_3143 [Acinetobacter baumannii 1295743]